MKVKLHGTNPDQLGKWEVAATLSYIDAHHYIPEGSSAENFDEGFLNTGFRILYTSGPVVVALVKRWPNYQLIAMHKRAFIEAYQKHYGFHPSRLGYIERVG